MEHEDITGKRYLYDIELATSSDPDAARRLIETFESAVRSGEPLPQELLRYFANCFRKILDGANPGVSLNVAVSKGRPKDQAMWLRDVELALAFEKFRVAGKTKEDAISEVATIYDVSDSTVQRAYLEYCTGIFK